MPFNGILQLPLQMPLVLMANDIWQMKLANDILPFCHWQMTFAITNAMAQNAIATKCHVAKCHLTKCFKMP